MFMHGISGASKRTPGMVTQHCGLRVHSCRRHGPRLQYVQVKGKRRDGRCIALLLVTGFTRLLRCVAPLGTAELLDRWTGRSTALARFSRLTNDVATASQDLPRVRRLLAAKLCLDQEMD